MARKWLALAERRRAHFRELTDTGRWRHYYSAAELTEEIRKAEQLCAGWAKNAGLKAGLDGKANPGLDSELDDQASHLAMLRQSLGLLSA